MKLIKSLTLLLLFLLLAMAWAFMGYVKTRSKGTPNR